MRLPVAAVVPGILALLVLDVVASVAGAEGRLAADSIRSQVIGHTFDGRMSDGTPMQSFFAPEGTVFTMFHSRLRIGEWRISGDQYCARWLDLDPDVWGCYSIVDRGDRGVALQRPNGTVQAHGALLDGDPLGLAHEN